MSNQNTRAPYGDIFYANTPYLDKVSDRLYAQQRQQELYKQQQDKVLDDEFSRNLTGIRDADIPELTQAYGEFKQARMNTLNKPNISPDIQLDVLRKKAGVYDIINKSKQQREWETAQGKQIMTDKKGMYADDAHQQLINRINTPLSKINTNNDANLLYKYYEPNLGKQLKEARGTEQEVPIKLGQSKTDPLKDDIEIYKAGNAPDRFANRLLDGILSANEGRNFKGIYNNKYDDAQLEDLKNRYAAKVNDPKFISVYGEPKPLPAPDTDLGRAVGIRTMEEFANMDLKPLKIKSEINDARATAQRQKFAMQQQARQFGHSDAQQVKAQNYRKAIIDYKADKSVEENESVLNKFIGKLDEAGSTKYNGQNVENVVIDGTSYKGKFIDVPKSVKSEYAIYNDKDKTWTYPDKFYLTEDKKTFIPLYFGSKTATGGNYFKSDSKPVPVEIFKASLAKVLLTKKATGEEVTADDADEFDGTPHENKKYNIKGKTYSHEDLNKMGYSDELINKAIKLGTIK